MNHSPTNPRLHKQLNQAITSHQEGKLARALELYHLVLKSAPKNITALQYLGILYGQTGRFEEALANYDRAIALNPGYASGTDANHLLPVFHYPFSLMPSVSIVMRRFL